MSSPDETHARILDGAMRAVARHGLGGLAMRDVAEHAGVARGTVYRHFPDREALLAEMAQREARRFMGEWRETLEKAPTADRIRVAFEYPARFAREHPLLERLVESDPDYVLRAIRENYDAIKIVVAQLLGPVIEETEFARRGIVSLEQLVDWTCRVMISVFLIPDTAQAPMADGLAKIHETLTGGAASSR
jgi:AcrR family transcriptional regulator